MTLPKALNNLFYQLNKQLAILIIKIEKKIRQNLKFGFWVTPGYQIFFVHI